MSILDKFEVFIAAVDLLLAAILSSYPEATRRPYKALFLDTATLVPT
jgi:hypothetical protein